MEELISPVNENQIVTSLPRKYLVFNISKENYAVPLSDVREILKIPTITSLPKKPNYFSGVFNLRGKIVSVIDMRKVNNIPKADIVALKNCIIIINYSDIEFGIIVDEAIQVKKIENCDIEKLSSNQKNKHHDWVDGVIRNKDDDNISLSINVNALAKLVF